MSSGDTAWVLTSAALVLLMTPGLAFFYGGMVRSRSVLNMIMMSMSAIAVVGVLWALFGYNMAFGTDLGAGLLGDPTEHFGLVGLLGVDSLAGSVPTTAFVAFQAMFAIITVALVSGAVADRAGFGAWTLFAALWSVAVYFPVAHWVFDLDGRNSAGEVVDRGGWIVNRLGAIDFAGGTAVHINAGAAGLVLALLLGRRRGWPGETGRPHNLPLVMLGSGLLFFGWFGFNAGSALAANTTAAVVFVNTLVATCAAVIGWLSTERVRHGRATSLGAASGVVAGLVAITPAGSSVTPPGAMAIGLVAGVLCALAVSVKFRLGVDDSLDVVGVHLVGGLIGTLLIGVFASASAPAGVDGLAYGGGAGQLLKQVIGAGAVLVYSLVVTTLIGLLIRHTVGFRVDRGAELTGIDDAEHAETAYDLGGFPMRRSATGPVTGFDEPSTTGVGDQVREGNTS
jgi:Amt family ammonium transporter